MILDNEPTRARLRGIAFDFVVVLGLCTVLGCGGSSSSFLTNASSNTTGPIISSVQYVDVDSNGVDAGDILIVEFDSVVRLLSENALSFEFVSPLDTLGIGADQSQSVPGSTRIELTLGASPILIIGASALNVKDSGTINVEDHFGDDVRPASVSVVISDATASAATLVRTSYVDADLDGTLNEGDTILAEFDKPVTVADGETVAGDFVVPGPVTGDSLVGTSLINDFTSGDTNRGILIRLDTGASVTVAGDFDSGSLGAGSPSGVEVDAASVIDDVTGLDVTTGTQVDLALQSSSFFHLNQTGDMVFGTTDATTSNVNAKGLFSPRSVFHYEGDVTLGGTTFSGVDLFFVADTGNNRVLIYDGRPSGNNASALGVLGQDDLLSNLSNRSEDEVAAPTANTLSAPSDVHYDPVTNQLFVSDTGNHRVLVWQDVLSDADADYDLPDGAGADLVLGHSTFTSGAANDGSVVSARSLSSPVGLHVADGRLGVADSGNNRVLMWSSLPTASNEDASTVLGQSNFSDSGASSDGEGADGSLSSPSDVFIGDDLTIDGGTGMVAVADTGNNRVLVWLDGSPASGDPAVRVLGQTGFGAGLVDANQGGAVGTDTLDSPVAVAADDDALYVADRDNHRLVYYDTGAVANGDAGDAFIGQTGGGVNSQNRGGTPADDTVAFPEGVAISEGSGTAHLLVADTANHRILDFEPVPTASDPSADLVQGHSDFASSDANGHFLNEPTAMAVTAGQMLVADCRNNRVLIYDPVPEDSDDAPTLVLGQDNVFDTLANQGGTAASFSLWEPEGVATDGTRVVVADTGNNRVLIWNDISLLSSGDAADIVLGQGAFTVGTANDGGLSGARMDSPVAVAVSGGKLLVADRDNNRVLVWNDISTVITGQSADVVIGQGDLVSNQANRGGSAPGQDRLAAPAGLLVANGLLYIADRDNNRVLGYGSIPVANGTPAAFVIGQFDFVSDSDSTDNFHLSAPTGLASNGLRLAVSDTGHHRIAIYDIIPVSSGLPFTTVLGQSNIGAGNPNRSSDTPKVSSFHTPRGVFFNGQDLWVGDSRNSRLVRYR